MKRGRFAQMAGAAVVAGAAPASTFAATLDPSSAPTTPNERAGGALVLGGGGARGAYQAGLIEGLRRAANVADGERIPGIDVVCGTSIGSINAWFVATGQYSTLRTLWANIGSEPIFELKRQFAAAAKPGAFVLIKIIAAIRLAQGLTKNVRGILDGGAVERWLDRHIDPRTPLVVPIVFGVTNLDSASVELFYRLPFAASSADLDAGVARLRSTIGASTRARPATDALLRPALRASAAIPILFDPVDLPAAIGIGTDRYVDGGIADNTPIDAARALAHAVYTVLLSPTNAPDRSPYADALEIAIGAFEISQDRVLDEALRSAYVETQGKRLFEDLVRTPAERAFDDRIFDADLYTLRPTHDLAVQLVEFDRQSKIDAAYATGLADAATGWQQYAPGPSA